MSDDAPAGGWSTIESDEVCPQSRVRRRRSHTGPWSRPGPPPLVLILAKPAELCAQGVFTFLIEQLGVKDVQFVELIQLDPDSIRALR